MGTETYTIEYEATDLINGPEGWARNYCWRDSGALTLPCGLPERAIVRRVKAALGLSGLRHYRLCDFGDEKHYRIKGACVGFGWRVIY